MNPMIKQQDTIPEVLEKGDFIAPPGGFDDSHGRSLWSWVVGLILTSLIPGLLAEPLIPFLGAVVLMIYAGKRTEGGLWVKLTTVATALLAICLTVLILGENTVPSLKSGFLYPVALYAALALEAFLPWTLALPYRKEALWLTVPAVAAGGLALLSVFGLGWAILRWSLVLAGVAGLVLGAIIVHIRERKEEEV